MRPIDADALKDLLIKVLESIRQNPKMTRDEIHIISGCHMLCEMIDDAPTVDAVPVVYARWKENRMYYRCTACDTDFDDGIAFIHPGEFHLPTYCPECGAKMDGGVPDEAD